MVPSFVSSLPVVYFSRGLPSPKKVGEKGHQLLGNVDDVHCRLMILSSEVAWPTESLNCVAYQTGCPKGKESRNGGREYSKKTMVQEVKERHLLISSHIQHVGFQELKKWMWGKG